MEAHEPRSEQFGAVLGSFGDGLVQKEGVADGAVEDTVKDVSERFALGFG